MAIIFFLSKTHTLTKLGHTLGHLQNLFTMKTLKICFKTNSFILFIDLVKCFLCLRCGGLMLKPLSGCKEFTKLTEFREN